MNKIIERKKMSKVNLRRNSPFPAHQSSKSLLLVGEKKITNQPETNQLNGWNCEHISIITLSVNGLNSPIKRLRLAGWINKQDPTTCFAKKHISLPKIPTG